MRPLACNGVTRAKNGTGIVSDGSVTCAKPPIASSRAAIATDSIAFGSVLMRNRNFVLVNALSSRSNISLMSTPGLMTLDNETFHDLSAGQGARYLPQQNHADANSRFTTTGITSPA